MSTCGGSDKCMCKKLADKHLEYKWIILKARLEPLMTWGEKQMKRDQENFDMYIYNGLTGYGTKEVWRIR